MGVNDFCPHNKYWPQCKICNGVDFNNEYIDERGYSHKINKGETMDMKNNNFLIFDEKSRISIGDKVKILNHKNDKLINKIGIIKYFAKTGKIMLTVEKWNQWVNGYNDIIKIPINILDQDPIESIPLIIGPIQKIMREPKYKIGQELKNNETNLHIGPVSSILMEYNNNNEIINIYYKFFNYDDIVSEEKLSDDIAIRHKYIKKYIEVEAHQTVFRKLLHTHNGDVWAEKGDYIIKDIEGKEYPCKKEIFEKTYDKVNIINLKDNIKNEKEVINKTYEILKQEKDSMFNYKFNIGDEVILIKTMNNIKGKISSRKYWNGQLQYGVCVDNIIRNVAEEDLKLYVIAIEEKNEKISKFKYNIEDEVLWSEKNNEIRKFIIKDRKIHGLPDKKEICQYKLDNDIWVNEEELNISNKLEYLKKLSNNFKWMLKSYVTYKDSGIEVRVQIVDHKITNEYILGKINEINEYRIVNNIIDKWVKENEIYA
jgi:hypothetical protein